MGMYHLILLIMKKSILIILLVFVSHICIAPAIDVQLKLDKFKEISEYLERKYHESEFSRFIDDLGSSESSNNWLCVNLIGCFGEWQFAESTLMYLGYRKITLDKFLSHPDIFPRELQMKALKTLITVNLDLLMDYQHFIGDSINGVEITKSGMIAASHLGGVATLMEFLNTDGKINRNDVLGTSICDYLKKFCNYDLD